MREVDRELLAEDAWRLRAWAYANKVSYGRWKPFSWIRYVMDRVQDSIMRGNARIIISAPPRHGKSEGVSHWMPTWYLDMFPENRIIFTSHSDTLAAKFGAKVRDDFMLNDHTWTRVKKTKKASDDWETTMGGGMRSAAIQGSITGLGANLMIIDDPHKGWEDAFSPRMREKVVDAFNSTLYTRLEPGGSIVVIQTRWHEADLSGYLIDYHEDNWDVIRLPAICEDSNDLLGRQIGDPLCDERWPIKSLDKVRKSVGPMVWAGLYQQRPAPKEGGILKRAWINRVWVELPEHIDEWVQSWDLTFGDTGNSFVVGQVWARSGANCYLVDQIREKLDFPNTIKAVKRLSSMWPQTTKKIVERKANGQALIDTLKDSVPGIVYYNPHGSKEARLAAVSAMFEAGNVYIPDASFARWVPEYVEELVTFPNGRNDDQVDATSQALDNMRVSDFDTSISLTGLGRQTSPWSFANAEPI